MSEQMKVFSNMPITTGRILPERERPKAPDRIPGERQSFQDVLNKVTAKPEEITFSAHALKRLKERDISLSDRDMAEIKQAVGKADDKGIRESLVVMKDVSFIVNIKNKTVITAVDNKNMKENVITNIDGAVFI